MNACRRGEALGNQDRRRTLGVADQVEAAGALPLIQPLLVRPAVHWLLGGDALQVPQPAACIEQGNQQPPRIINSRAVGLDAFPGQVGVAGIGGLGCIPDALCPCRRLGMAFGFFGFPYLPYGACPFPISCRFFRSQLASNVSPPCLGDAGAPVPKNTRRDTVTVQHIPAGIIASFATAGEAPQLAICFDHIGRRQTGGLYGLAKFFNGVDVHARPPACPASCR